MGSQMKKLILLTVTAVISTYVMSNSMLALISQYGDPDTKAAGVVSEITEEENKGEENKIGENGQVNQQSLDKVYIIQNGVFKEKQGAENLKTAINYHGFPAFIVEQDEEYRVFSNVHSEEKILRTILEQQREKGLDNYLVNQKLNKHNKQDANYLFKMISSGHSTMEAPSEPIKEIIYNFNKWKETEDLSYKNLYHGKIYEMFFLTK
ncbi:hypothetical protein PRVXH_001073 [Proteinivorax hydrogeniformans]|uniref:Sporulation related protein n=1 Tax=Proteinivorax hydrogeniformans TaxID=1826727 RepID=A0AAU8HWE6_9FIRM